MGNANATNQLNSAITDSITILNTTTQNCVPKSSEQQIIDISGCCNVNINGITYDQLSFVNTTCVENATSNTATQITVKNQVKQKAASIVGELGLGTSDASNLINTMIDLATNIINSFSQTCAASISNEQILSIKCPSTCDCKNNSNGCTANINNVSLYQSADQLATCTLTSSSVSSAKDSITQIIDQSATATVQGLGGLILLIIIIVLVFFFAEGKLILYLLIIVIPIFVILIAFAYFKGIFPFKKKKT